MLEKGAQQGRGKKGDKRSVIYTSFGAAEKNVKNCLTLLRNDKERVEAIKGPQFTVLLMPEKGAQQGRGKKNDIRSQILSSFGTNHKSTKQCLTLLRNDKERVEVR